MRLWRSTVALESEPVLIWLNNSLKKSKISAILQLTLGPNG